MMGVARGSAKIPVGYAQTLEEGVVSCVVRTGELRLVPDVRQDLDYVALFPEVRSEICLPLRMGGEVIVSPVCDRIHRASFRFSRDGRPPLSRRARSP